MHVNDGEISSGSVKESLSWSSISTLKTPAVFKNRLAGWKCSNWTLEDWANECGDIIFKFRSSAKENSTHWESQSQSTQARLTDFLSWLISKPSELGSDHPLKLINSDRFWCYSSYNYMAELFKDKVQLLNIVDWSVFGLNGRGGYESTLWIGSQGSNTPCHQDSYGSNLVAQLLGEKLWVLFPPDSENVLYPTRFPYEESSVFSAINILQPDLQFFPNFRNSTPYMVILRPGDVLYVPPKWWHFVYCLNSAVSVNTWVENKLDDQWRLEEAIVRFSATALIPTFGQSETNLINTTEELLSSAETIKLLQLAMTRAKQVDKDIIEKCENVSKHNQVILPDTTEIKPLSFELFERDMLKLTNYQVKNGSHKSSVLELVNCFLARNVVNMISENIKRTYT